MLQTIILDDEPKAIQSLEWEIKSFCKNIEVIKTFIVASEAILFLQHNQIDCLFLDIDMPEMDGFKFLEHFPSRNFSVIITTAYDQYGIQACKSRAIDYLLKPVDSDDLMLAVAKIEKASQTDNLKDIIEDLLVNINNLNKLSNKKININCDGKIYFLDPSEIMYCESDGNYTTIFLANGQKLVLTQILKLIEEKLPSELFFRVHNSFIVNLSKVREFQKNDALLILENSKSIPVSRTKKSLFTGV